MRTKNYLLCCAAFLALAFTAATWAQPRPQQTPALSPEERQQLRDLLREFDPERPDPTNLPIYEQRWLLTQLRDISVFALAQAEDETLTVCDVIGNPHLRVGDVVKLNRLGASGNVRMEVLRDAGTPMESHPWTDTGGANTFMLNPSITGKAPNFNNPAFKKFTPEGVGRARVNVHPDGAPTNHDFAIRRNERVPDDKCKNPDPLLIQVPEQHPAGNRHGGTAVLD